MWPLRRINTAPSSPRSTSFSCSSFKDVQSLCSDDDDRHWPQPNSPVASPRNSPTVFQRIRISASSFALRHASSLPTALSKVVLHKEERITVYFTSLRVVRKTYDDSVAVRSILRGYRVPIDERDLWMDSRYVEELRGLVAGGRKVIPCVFVGRRCVGGAEEVRRLHESGELREMIAGGLGDGGGGGPRCRGCGGRRYVVCGQCHGGRKVCVDKSGFRCCDSCNVNGLVRCSRCMGL